MFVVGISGRIKRLHQVGRCHRVPGVDHARYEVIGPMEPPGEVRELQVQLGEGTDTDGRVLFNLMQFCILNI